MYQKYDIVLVDLNPTIGSEQSGIRPCLIIQNNRANRVARTFVVAIITSSIKQYPHTLILDKSEINGLSVQSRVDVLQIRTVDKKRIIKLLGTLELEYQHKIDDAIRIGLAV